MASVDEASDICQARHVINARSEPSFLDLNGIPFDLASYLQALYRGEDSVGVHHSGRTRVDDAEGGDKCIMPSHVIRHSLPLDPIKHVVCRHAVSCNTW